MTEHNPRPETPQPCADLGTDLSGMGRRIGIVGGTFDPVHVGHLFVAVAARHALALNTTLLVVAHVPWQKVGDRQVTPSALRLAMVEAAVADYPGIDASDIEIRRGGDSYTIDTVEAVAAANPEAEIFVVLGSDVAPNLNTWHRHNELADMAKIAVIDRPGSIGARPPAGWDWQHVETPSVNVSSTMLRQRLRAGEPVDFVVPAEALAVYRRAQADPTAFPQNEAPS